jgi:NADH:ubiquinone oxidoreductase subunit 4 (subunit M)
LLISLIICLIQSDLKRQIAYSSISHISVVFYNLIIFNSFSEKFSFLVIIGHAFRRGLIFWFVGEIFYSIKRRLVIEVNSFFISNFFFFQLFFLTLFILGSFPFRLSYFTEYYIFFALYKSYYFLFFFV